MEIDELANLVLSSGRISSELADEVMNYGISEFLKAAVGYDDALTIIEKAEIALEREKQQNISFGKVSP